MYCLIPPGFVLMWWVLSPILRLPSMAGLSNVSFGRSPPESAGRLLLCIWYHAFFPHFLFGVTFPKAFPHVAACAIFFSSFIFHLHVVIPDSPFKHWGTVLSFSLISSCSLANVICVCWFRLILKLLLVMRSASAFWAFSLLSFTYFLWILEEVMAYSLSPLTPPSFFLLFLTGFLPWISYVFFIPKYLWFSDNFLHCP